ncbi:hypothetical protein ACIOHC_43325 [Streptomyces sp. NPDC088252]|uniref:hypothetical protein n=1 Tax=unclassified Streptomyces TaxID=2593676 RepID=UPI00342D53B3
MAEIWDTPKPPGRGTRSEDDLNSLGFDRRFEARKEIHREVTGLTREQIHERWAAAGGLDNRENQPGPLSTEDRLAAVRRNELKRIWTLMTEGGWETYSPESDPEVHRWQRKRRERQERESRAAAGREPGLIRYRIVAQRTDPAHPGAALLTNYTYGRSVEEAVSKVRQELEKPGGLYGDQGMYRVVEVVEESPDSVLRQQKDARRRYLTTILENAITTVRGREPDSPDADLLSLLDDFFTRAVVFPDPHGSGVQPRPHQATFGWTSEPPGIEHASDPGRALAPFLLAYLDHHGRELVQASARPRSLPDERTDVGRPSGRGTEAGEGSEAPAELVERVMEVCGRHYAAVTGTSFEQWDTELFRENVGIALRTVRLAEREAYPQALEDYLQTSQARLRRLWGIYGPDGLFPGVHHLVELPECFVLCEHIEHSPLWLSQLWAQETGEETPLERLEEAWLYGTNEKDERFLRDTGEEEGR